jgi:ABC-2 type transport system permease protein
LIGGSLLLSFDTLLRLALLTIVVTAYGGFWFVLAVAINALGKNSATNAMICAGTWLALVIVVPLFFNVIATSAYPTPPRTEMIRQMREAWIEAEAEGGRLAESYYIDHPELMPEDLRPDIRTYAATSFYAEQEAIDNRVEPILEEFDGQVTKQQRFIQRFQFLSPAIIANDLLSDIAGTSADRFRRFRAVSEDFHKEWREFFVYKIFRKETFTLADYHRIPVFKYEEEPINNLLGRLAFPLAGLLIPTFLMGIPAAVALQHYPITHESQ